MPDLAAHEGAALEWWFFQGRLEGEKLGRRDFMLSLFRHRGKGNAPDGHMLLASTLDPDSGCQRLVSQVSPQLIENFLADTPAQAREAGIDAHVTDALLEEIAAGGPPAPIRRDASAIEMACAPFAIRWNGTRIAQRNGAIDLAFRLPGEDIDCALAASPLAPWLTGQTLERGVASMDYDCCPRLALRGHAGGEQVSGRLWFDHQWGEYGWLHGEGPGAGLLGWTWFGINLDDGSDLMIIRRNEIGSGKHVSSFCVLFEPGKAPLAVHDVVLEHKRHWQSPQSLVEYPVAFDISVAELDLRLAFAPAADGQEIPVFGVMGTIWQGAGTVEGTRRGMKVAGAARLELQGFGSLADLGAYIGRWAARIDGHLADFLPRAIDGDRLAEWAGAPRFAYDAAAQTQMLSRPAWDLLDRGGKHWRPIFGLLLLDALGAERTRFEALMSVMPELIHNASLIIDDIEDGSLTRRGAASIHRRHGLATAINAANTLYFLPLREISRHEGLSGRQREEIFAVVMRMFTQAHLGQAQDLYWSQLEGRERARLFGEAQTGALILQTHAFKSAAAVTGIAEIACIIAGAPAGTRAAAARLAESWGTAFQVVDDVNNFASSPDWGKVRGEDVSEGKVTYPIHVAMQRLAGADRNRLEALLGDEAQRRSAAGLNEAIALIEASGALEQSRAEARALFAADWPALAAALPASPARFMLRAMLTSLLDLRFET